MTSWITTPIYYVNDAPHVGSAYSTVLADALARWGRLRGADVRLSTGTDEHGLKVQRAAAAADVPPRAWADRTSARFRTAWDTLDVEYAAFYRTTTPAHAEAARDFLRRLYDNGHVYRGRYTGRYCVGCESYVDQDVCPVHRRPTEELTEDNWFFRLSAFGGALLDWYADRPDAIRPASRRNEAIAFVERGLRDLSISRAGLRWGVPLPWDGQVVYVWIEALVNYLATAGHAWPAVHHVIGKDILTFHAVYWPALLLAAGYPPPERITAHGFLLASGEKVSKSGVTGVPLADLVDAVGADGLRYHLLRYPVGPDGDFSYEGLLARYNADLANTLGNLVSRLTALVASRRGGVAPAPHADAPLAPAAARAVGEAGTAWDADDPAGALAATWRLVAATNGYLVAEEPWRSADPGPVLGDCVEALRLAALLASPAVPAAATEIARRIGTADQALAWGGSEPRRVIRGEPLFPRAR